MIITFTEDAEEQRSYLTRRAVARGTESQAYLLGRRTAAGWRIEHVVRAGNPLEEVARTRADYGAAGLTLLPYLQAGLLVAGEWHPHANLPGPSAGDVRTLRAIASTFPEYLCVITSAGSVTTAHSIVHGALLEHHVVVEQYPVLARTAMTTRALLQVGAGSGGSTIWPAILSLGFGRLTIIDGDVLEPPNLARHLIAASGVGKNKAVLLKRFARGRTTSTVSARAYHLSNATQQRFEREVATHDIVVNATGHPLVSLRISHTARKHHKPVLHAGVLARARGGFVYLEQPDGPCYACLHGLNVRPDDNDTLRTLQHEYGYTLEQLESQAGLLTDIQMTASLQTKVLLEWCKGNAVRALYRVQNDTITITKHDVSQRPDCICKGEPT